MTEQIKPKLVRRFAFDAESMYETEHGKYVMYSDHAETVQQLQQRNDDLSRACELMRKALNTIRMETGNEKHCSIATNALLEEIKVRRG